jgi:hypothetical protein
MSENIFILGDSHVSTLVHAVSNYGIKGLDGAEMFKAIYVDSGAISQDFVLYLKDGSTVLNPIVLKCLADCGLYGRYTHAYDPAAGELVVLFGYADSHIYGFQYNLDGYVFTSSLDRPVPGGLPINGNYMLSDRILEELFRPRVKALFEGLQILKAGGCRLSLLSGPPIHRDNDFILSCLPWGRVNAPEVRRAVFEALHRVIAESARKLEIDFIDGASDFVDGDGFLKKEFQLDGVHANPLYGREIILSMAQKRKLSLDCKPANS